MIKTENKSVHHQIIDHQQVLDDLWMALTGEVDLDSENYNDTKLKQTPINGVTCNDCKLKRSSEIKVVVFPQ